MSENNQSIALVWRLIIGLLVVAGLSGLAYYFWPWPHSETSGEERDSPTSEKRKCLSAYGTSEQSARRSLGEKILISKLASEEKQAGVKAFANCDFKTAAATLQAYLEVKSNDPEALIYWHNAKAANNKEKETLKIVASVPIGKSPNFAQELLRGVAQAQKEVNGKGGINGKQLLVEIANDDNDPATVKELAAQFVADPKILAVVGHNSSSASEAGAPIYEQEGLVMVSATSGSMKLSQFQDYVFRTVPNARVYAEAMANGIYETYYEDGNLNKIAICFDSKDSYSTSFQGEFIVAIADIGVSVPGTECDLAVPSENFDANAISDAIAEEADGLLLAASVENLPNAISIIKANHANQKKLPLFATRNMYVNETIEEAGEAAEGMMLVVPWYSKNTDFFKKASKLWNAKVNWRTAMAYDAAGVIIAGLEQGNSREDLQKALSHRDFSLEDGVTGTVKFLTSGDRLVENPQQEVTIEPKKKPEVGYEFVLQSVE